jgi:hypothetical protein
MKITDINDPRQAEGLSEVTTGIAARVLRCHPTTLRKMQERGEIECTRTATGRCLWRVRKYLERTQARGA